jgi:hypothetical protein
MIASRSTFGASIDREGSFVVMAKRTAIVDEAPDYSQ